MRVRVHVSLKEGVLDVQGKAVEGALHSLGHDGISNVRQGKFFTFEVTASSRDAAAKEAEDVCRKLLANTVIEDFRCEVADDAAGAGR